MNNQSNPQCTCKQEARIKVIETKLDNKKEHLHEVDEDYYHLRDKLDMINLNVTELKTIITEMQNVRTQTDNKVYDLQVEINKMQLQLKESEDRWNSLKFILGIGVPVITTILTVIANYIII